MTQHLLSRKIAAAGAAVACFLGMATLAAAPAHATQAPAPPINFTPKGYNVNVYSLGSPTNATYPWSTALDAWANDPALQHVANNTPTMTGFQPNVWVLPGDTLTWTGIVAISRNTVNTPGSGEDYLAAPAGLWSPQAAAMMAYATLGATPTLTYPANASGQILTTGTVVNPVTGDEWATGCADPSSPDTWPALPNHPATIWNYWCKGPALWTASVTTYPLGNPWYNTYSADQVNVTIKVPEPGMVSLNGAPLSLGGPEDPQVGLMPTTSMSYQVALPSLTLVKQVCLQGSGCDPAVDPATPDMATKVDRAGMWVDIAAIPPDSTAVQWRLTAFNTGNVALQGVKVASDTITNPDPDHDGDVLASDCATQTFPDLAVGGSGSVTCTNPIKAGHGLDSLLTNTAQLTSRFAETGPDGLPLVNRLAGQQVLSNQDDAAASEPIPGMKLTKWVCGTYDASGAPTCTVPAQGSAVLASLAGIGTQEVDGEYAVTAGAPAGGWVKEAYIPYGATAQWLVVTTNTGSAPLVDVTVADALAGSAANAAMHYGASTGLTAAWPDPANAGRLMPGESATFTFTTADVTNQNATVPGTYATVTYPDSGEPDYMTGASDVVNTAQATGQAVNPADLTTPLVGEYGVPWPPTVSNESNAEVGAPAYAVGDYVWIDADGNGIQDAGETPIPGVTVTLLNADGTPATDSLGNPVAPTTTDTNGYYTFDQLAAGDYIVQFTLPTGYIWTQSLQGTDPKVDSDAAAATRTAPTAKTAPFTLGPSDPNLVYSATVSGNYSTTLVAAQIDPTLDAGVLLPVPSVAIEKYDTDDGDTAVTGAYDSASDPKVLKPNTPSHITFTVTNDGNEPLSNVIIKDTPAAGSAALTGLSCLVPGSATPIAANATTGEVTWAGPFAPDAVITCTGTLPAVPLGDTHRDVASVSGTGEYSATPVNDSNPWNAVVPSYAVGDYVWQDDNGNGIQDAAEPPIPGVTVTLLDGTGATVATTTTDANGYYLFDMLPAGDYQVKFTLPTGAAWTTPLAGTDRAVDSNADKTTGLSAVFTLDDTDPQLVPSTDPSVPADYTVQAMSIDPTIDAGIIPAPAIAIEKYDTLGGDTRVTGAHDTAADAKQLVDGATTPITFLVTNDGLEPLVNVVIKDTPASGSSALTGLSCLVPGSATPIAANATTGEVTWAGPFAVNAVITCTGTLPAVALGATHADTASVTGAGEYSGTSVNDQNEWHGFVPSFAVGDYVWQDDNGNGIQDATEPPIPGVTVTLLDGTGATVATTTTDAAGYYLFDMLPAGDYQVKFTLPNGASWTTQWAPSDVTKDSDADTNGLSALFTLDVGQTDLVASTDPSLPTDYTVAAQWVNPTIDAGIIPPAHVDIQKYDTLGTDDMTTGDHDTAADPKVLTQNTTTPISFTITNDGQEPLVDITVKDTPALGSVALTGLSCTFPDSTTGLTWAGPFAVGASFTCTGTLPGVPLGGVHADTASVIGTGEYSGTPVDSTDEWHAVVPSYAVGDYVWIDQNGNGIQDAAEPPIQGVTVTLLDGTGATVATTTTDAAGYYLFDMLPAGDYQVKFTLPTGYDWTTPLAGTDPAVDSNADKTTGLSAVFTLDATDPQLVPFDDPSVPADYTVQAMSIDPTIDAGVIPVPGVTIIKYDGTDPVTGAHDTAADAKQLVDGATTPITFTVTNDGTEPLVNVVIKDTPASGSSALTGLSCLVPGSTTPIAANATTGEVTWAGPFAVNAVITCTGTLPAVALGATHADTASVTGAGEYTGTSVSDQNEWHGFVPSFAVGDYVWQDDNGNGIQNTGEPPVTGVTVTLLDGTGATVATTTTDAAGYYLFDMLPAGDYQVKFTLPSGDTWTTSLAGTDRAVDSNADTNGLSALFTLDVGQTGLVASTDPSLPTDYTAAAQWVNPTVDAGIIPPAHVDIQKYDTLNGDTKVTGDHDTAADPKVLTQDTTTPITFTITNDGLEPLVDITVKDTPALGSVALTGLSCTFPDATTGVTWAGPFAVGASFTCTGTLPGVPLDGTHADTASVIGTGEFSGSPVDSTDEWHAVVPSYAVGDYVWIDLNGNGIQDANEPIVPGVTVKLLDGTGAVVATTTTDASGYFLFDDLPAGTYQLQFTLPAGYDWTKPVQGTDQKVDSDADSAGLTAQFTLGDGAPNLVPSTDPTVPPDYTVKAGAVNPTIDAGIIPVPVIAIEKYDTLAGDTRVTGAHDTSADAKTLVADTTTPITMLITNTGTEPLLNITVTDTPATGSAALTGLTCTFPDATTGVTWAGPFAAGASFTCTGRLPGMAANTAHTDTASVVGTGQYTGTTVNAANEWHAIVPAQVVTHPALTIVKTAYPADPSTQPCPWPVATGGTPKVTDPACQPPSTDATGPVPQLKVGATAYYDFLVTNTGDVTLTNVTVSETDFSGLGTMSAITCPQTTLDPGQFMHCSATYVVQQGDLPPGKVINVAQSTGKEPGGSLVTSNTSTAKITVVAPPAGPLGGVAGATGYAMAAGWIMMALGLAIGLYYMGSVATRRREEATR